jgi:glutathione S-transferase
VPRRLIRWGLRHHRQQRRWFADVATPLPAPALVGIMLTPVVPAFVRQAGASDERVRRDLAELPGLLNEVDRLLEIGVIGGEELGAADFQIASTVRTLLAMNDVGRLVAGRPAESFAELAARRGLRTTRRLRAELLPRPEPGGWRRPMPPRPPVHSQ